MLFEWVQSRVQDTAAGFDGIRHLKGVDGIAHGMTEQ